ncbi:MAG TPA: flagellar basal body rod protein FlgC [Oligoflexia bacterium]|nr:flagellar basal body rod protein FlgC [Oligoflexia bacterium]HMP47580.1 flagellar basal body rod protein FlgC [Oligoflexia bacterium]
MMNKVFDIAASAMSANRLRINTVASNIANHKTTRTEEGGPYKRRDVVFKAEDVKSTKFDSVLDQAGLKTVRVAEVIQDESPPEMVYDPGHPDADKETGMVSLPNINVVSEMTNMLSASNAYKAAAKIVDVTQEMSQAVRSLFTRL